jgi:ABC-2 type transport system ATP-binding protein
MTPPPHPAPPASARAGDRPLAPPAAAAVLETEALCVSLAGRSVLRDITLRVPAGEILGVVGPNGAGKTTLYRTITGLGRPTSGRIILFGGRSPDARSRKRIGYMPQNEALYPELSGRENLAFFGRVYGLGGDRLRRRMTEVLELVALRPRADDRVDRLSGGMRRRLSLAVALLHEPDLVILDEPTVGVDPELRAAFWLHFAELKATGRTVIVSTHHLDEATRCDRVALLREGTLLACAPPAELVARTGGTDLETAYRVLAKGTAPQQPPEAR